MRFEFSTAGRIIFGAGSLSQLGGAIGELTGSRPARALVMTGASGARLEHLYPALAEANLAPIEFRVKGEPSTDTARDGVRLAREARVELVVGFGGGSAIDAAKAVAALAANGGDPLDYLEVVGRGRPLAKASLPVIAVPTTAGTGAEVTRNAVLLSHDHRVKASLRSPSMLPRVALVDPELTYTMPPDVTASTGLDALTQLIEPFTSRRANPLTDGICREGLRCAAGALGRAVNDGTDRAARHDMSLASLLGGLALANAGLGVVHGFAGPVGGVYPAPHGAVCAALLPHAIRANVTAMRRREPDNPALTRYSEIAAILTGQPGANAEDGAEWIEAISVRLAIPSLRAYGITDADVPGLVEKTAAASSTKANPIALLPDELDSILRAALG